MNSNLKIKRYYIQNEGNGMSELIEVNKNENYLGISIEVDSDDVSFNVLFP
jgi:hypothetical protein